MNQYPLVIIKDFNMEPIEMFPNPRMNPNTIKMDIVKKNTWKNRDNNFLRVGLIPNHPDINTKTSTATIARLWKKILVMAFPGAKKALRLRRCPNGYEQGMQDQHKKHCDNP